MATNISETHIKLIINRLLESTKYSHINAKTIEGIVRATCLRYKSSKQIQKASRHKLHKIVAPYLGDPDYADLLSEFEGACTSEDILNTCKRAMAAHISTRERLQLLGENIYGQIFEVTGTPLVIMDIACGLNPLAIPWMDLPRNFSYIAYDIHKPRINLLNKFFFIQGYNAVSKLQDIAFDTPKEEADVVFFLKELPRYEQNYGNSSHLLKSLRAKFIVVSFPILSIKGNHEIAARYKKKIYEFVVLEGWKLTELKFQNELVFCIEKLGSVDL